MGECVRNRGDQLGTHGRPSHERHVGQAAGLIEVSTASLLGFGLLAAAFLCEIDRAGSGPANGPVISQAPTHE